MLGVISIHPASSGPDMLLLLLKALISISVTSTPVRTPTNSSQSDTLQVKSHILVKQTD